MNRLVKSIGLIAALASTGPLFAGQSLWQDATPATRTSENEVTSIHYFDSNEQALRDFLVLVPGENTGSKGLTIQLPMPDGSLASFSIVESPVMQAELAASFPHIKTFKVYGIDDPAASGRVDISQKGFRAMLHTSQGRVFIDPQVQGSGRYMARSRDSVQSKTPFMCRTGELVSNRSSQFFSRNPIAQREQGSYLTYRLAVSATPEYVVAVGGTNALAMTEIVTVINRVNQIYERDLGIRLVLIANNNLLIDDLDVNGFSNNDQFALLGENQTWVDNTIGIANYDIGHIFSTGDGGVATLESVCDNSTSLALADQGTAAMGVTGLPNPAGDLFYIDFVAHEIGHQFGANHSFNGTTDSCGAGNRNATTAFEPGSGSTIMAYAGICGLENIQPSSDATFHAGSMSEIHNFTVTDGTCNGTLNASNPTDPVASAGMDRTIPVGTPFMLQGTGTDMDSPADSLSYQWDQMDAGTATSSANLGDDLGDNALFRIYLPQPSGDRDFPALGTQVVDGPFDQSETLPCSARTLNFRLTVRDQKSGQGTDDVQIMVDNTSGPFRITSHNTATTIVESSPRTTLTWAVANTTSAPVSCANVDIDLLTFSAGHASYSVTTLVLGTPNDGIESVRLPLPVQSSSSARFRVKCSDNIFYAVSNADTDIQGNPADGNYSTSDNTTFFNTSGQVFSTSGTCNLEPAVKDGGGGAFDNKWMLLMFSLLLPVRLWRNRKAPGPDF